MAEGDCSSAQQAKTRFRRELERLSQDLPRTPIVSVRETVSGSRLRADISGPEGSPFANARFGIDVDVGEEYPFKPPKVRFASPERVYHPNICPRTGGICLDILHDPTLWSPAMGIEKLLLGVASLLSEPRTEHGLNNEALELLRSDPSLFESRAAARAAGGSAAGGGGASSAGHAVDGVAAERTRHARANTTAAEPPVDRGDNGIGTIHAAAHADARPKDISCVFWLLLVIVIAAVVAALRTPVS